MFLDEQFWGDASGLGSSLLLLAPLPSQASCYKVNTGHILDLKKINLFLAEVVFYVDLINQDEVV